MLYFNQTASSFTSSLQVPPSPGGRGAPVNCIIVSDAESILKAKGKKELFPIFSSGAAQGGKENVPKFWDLSG
jgi:hypothetical protein